MARARGGARSQHGQEDDHGEEEGGSQQRHLGLASDGTAESLREKGR
jgi:hypothetical protein